MPTINKQAVEELATLLKEHNLQELDYQQNDLHIKVVAAHAVAQPQVIQTIEAPVAAATPEPQPPVLPLDKAVLAPIVGVAYLAATPGGDPYVKVGDKIKVGQTLCLIEAMKTFNPIKATRAGTVTQILIEDASPVEYNEPLMIVE